MSFVPHSRTAEYESNGNGTKSWKCYGPSTPHYYKDGNGSYHSIDLSHTSSLSNSNVGNFTLKDKNVQSLGIRQDDNKEKYIGIRPDETQDGSQQFEWTIISASVNGEDVPIDLSKNDFVNNNQVDLGNVTLFSTRQFTRQMLHYTGSINDFKVEYKLHLTGLKVSGSKYTSSTTLSNSNNVSVGTDYYKENSFNQFVILDNDDNTKYRIAEPKLLDSNFNIVETSGSVHTLKDNGDGTYNYTKYPASSSINNISSSVSYIDAETIYTDNALDGGYSAGSLFLNWDQTHDASTGTSLLQGFSYAKTGVLTSFGSHTIHRVVSIFDTSGITDTVQETVLYSYIRTIQGSPSFIVLSGSHDSSGYNTSNYAAPLNPGSSLSGWGTSDVTAFSGETTPSDTEEYLLSDLNSSANTNIKNADEVKIMYMDHDNDYSDASETVNNTTEIYMFENSGTSKDAYLYVTEGEAVVTISHPTVRLFGGIFDLKNGNLRIK